MHTDLDSNNSEIIICREKEAYHSLKRTMKKRIYNTAHIVFPLNPPLIKAVTQNSPSLSASPSSLLSPQLTQTRGKGAKLVTVLHEHLQHSCLDPSFCLSVPITPSAPLRTRKESDEKGTCQVPFRRRVQCAEWGESENSLYFKKPTLVLSEPQRPKIQTSGHNKYRNSGLGKIIIINHKRTFWHKYETKGKKYATFPDTVTSCFILEFPLDQSESFAMGRQSKIPKVSLKGSGGLPSGPQNRNGGNANTRLLGTDAECGAQAHQVPCSLYSHLPHPTGEGRRQSENPHFLF